MQTVTPSEALLTSPASSAARDEQVWDTEVFTTDHDIEIDSVTPQRMETLRNIADRYAPAGASPLGHTHATNF